MPRRRLPKRARLDCGHVLYLVPSEGYLINKREITTLRCQLGCGLRDITHVDGVRYLEEEEEWEDL